MAKDIVQEAVEQAEAMKEAAYENAKSVLVNAMSTNLKAAVSEAIGEKVNEAGTPKGASVNVNYDPEGLKGLEGDDLTDEGDGPAIIEAGVDEGDEYGGGKGDESRSRRDYEDENEQFDDEDEDEDELEGDEFGGGKGDESRSRRDYEAALEADDDEDSDIDVDIDVDDDEDEDDDIDEVLEIIEDEDEDEEDVDVDVDVDEDEDIEERGRKFEATVKENRQLRRENRRYEKALTFLKKRIDEVNLFNARLAAASDMMRKVSLTKDEKERVIEHFDRARSVNEVKRTFRALHEGYRSSKRSVKKQRISRPNVQSVLTEDQKNQNTNQSQFDRMAELAGL